MCDAVRLPTTGVIVRVMLLWVNGVLLWMLVGIGVGI